jgi:signal peptidase II
MLVLILGIAIAFFDQLTKHLVHLGFALGESRPVIPGFFDFTYVRNTGAAWGMLGGQNTALTILSIVMLVVMLVFRRSFLSDTWDHRVALGLMIGGIVGNLMDRMRFGYVVDFLDFHVGGYHWPAFNIADAAICIGVGIYILSALWASSHPLNAGEESRNEPARDHSDG